MSTVCNMSAEIGSTSCIFPYSDAMGRYLAATDRSYIAAAAQENLNLLQPDADSEKHYDDIIEISLSTLEPHINGPFTPDLSHTLSSFAGDVEKSSWPKDISHAMIGSCTNASFEDLSKAATLFREARGAGLKPKMPVFITAASSLCVYSTLQLYLAQSHVSVSPASPLSLKLSLCFLSSHHI